MKKLFSAYRISQRPMLLLELLIAMALTMAILTILIGFYDQIDRVNTAMEKEQGRSFHRLYLSTRLASVLPKTIPLEDAARSRGRKGEGFDNDFCFFTTRLSDGLGKPGTTSLFFSYDNGVKLDPVFSNHVLGLLYVNNSNQLCLATWPSPIRWETSVQPPMKNEILYEHIDGFTMEFYLPPAKERQQILASNKKKIKVSPTLVSDLSGGWKNEWLQEYEDLPAMIRLRFSVNDPRGSESFVLTYPLPKSHQIILYDR